MSNARFSIVPAWIVTDSRLKGNDLKVLCLLGSYTNKEGWCRRSQVKMADELGCGRSTVQAALNRLYEIGVVEKRQVDSVDGRDSAHYYRVIHDRSVSDKVMAAWTEAAEDEEFGPIEGADADTPPATIVAPPATSGMAPPATSGPAPINDTSLTNTSNEGERGRARESLEGRSAIPGTAEFRKRVQCFLSGEGYHEGEWPKWAKSTTIDYITRHFAALPEPDRKLAEANRDAFLVKCRKDGGQVMGAGNYFRDRAWEPLSESDRKLPEHAPVPDKAFSKAWMGLELSILLAPDAPMPRLTSYLQGVVLEGGPKADATRREHRMRYAWPRVTEMHNGYKPLRVPTQIAKASEGFKSYNALRDAAIVDAWKRLYEYRDWPWPSVRDDGWICLPETTDGSDAAVDAALETFKGKISRGQGDEHAA